MHDFKKIEDVLDYIQTLLHIDNKDIIDIDIDNFSKIKKLSPEKIAKRFNLDELTLVKEFNQYKKQINKKIIIYNKVKKLKDVEPIPFTFNYSGNKYKTKISVCYKLFEVKYRHHLFTFYPQVKYLYVELNEENIILFNDSNYLRLYSTTKEFNEHFIDSREYKINQIINFHSIILFVPVFINYIIF